MNDCSYYCDTPYNETCNYALLNSTTCTLYTICTPYYAGFDYYLYYKNDKDNSKQLERNFIKILVIALAVLIACCVMCFAYIKCYKIPQRQNMEQRVDIIT